MFSERNWSIEYSSWVLVFSWQANYLDKLFMWSMRSQHENYNVSSKLHEINVLEACRTWSYSLSSASIFVHPLAPLFLLD
jgi:hypothetical protein